tara:strand:- start:291 stop:599 length:309 start_codon:yes stop_codon:yes gene_type:complete
MSGGGSFTSDQNALTLTTVGADTLGKAGRMRITSIQAKGIASAAIIFYDSADASSPGTAKATFNYGTEGLEIFIPGSGILLKKGLTYNLAGAGGSVTITYTG